jgi:hypothetical protein
VPAGQSPETVPNLLIFFAQSPAKIFPQAFFLVKRLNNGGKRAPHLNFQNWALHGENTVPHSIKHRTKNWSQVANMFFPRRKKA